MANECYTYFRIAGEFDPDEISARLGLEPFKSRRIGDLRVDGVPYDCAMWCVGRCDEYDFDANVQIRKTIAPLLGKTAELRAIKEEYDAVLFLEVVPTIYGGEFIPQLGPDEDVIRFCCEAGAAIDIDLYLGCEGEPGCPRWKE